MRQGKEGTLRRCLMNARLDWRYVFIIGGAQLSFSACVFGSVILVGYQYVIIMFIIGGAGIVIWDQDFCSVIRDRELCHQELC